MARDPQNRSTYAHARAKDIGLLCTGTRANLCHHIYHVTFEHRGADQNDAAAVKRFLKQALRVGGLRCIHIAELPTPVDITPHPRLEDK